jgi:8-oxo-(d)GTP phosphatase
MAGDDLALPILAAGCVIWRRNNSDEIEIAIVHRPRYDDWSFPKGKVELSEPLIACARRESIEETGLDLKIGQFIGDVSYQAEDGLKLVHYWAAQAMDDSGDFIPNSEIDALEWVEISKVSKRLTRDSDKEILKKFKKLELETTPLILLRHAKALAREEWPGGDEDRPLDTLGQDQARRMLSIYQVFNLKEIHTSDAVRCYDTIIQMARALSIEPIISTQLSEYTYKKNKDKSKDYVKELAGRVSNQSIPILLCSHNPVIPAMLDKLLAKSKVKDPQIRLKPGQACVLHLSKKRLVAIETLDSPK